MWSILELIGSVGKEWLVGKVEIKKAETAARIANSAKRIEAESDWETTMAKASATSWKDEWWTILISVPLVLVFFDATRPAVQEGFVALENMPPWYIYLTSVAFAAAFGVRPVIKAVKGMINPTKP